MAAKDHWKYYQEAWQHVKGRMEIKMAEYGFAPQAVNGKYEVGNEHGEVWLYPAPDSPLSEKLHMAEICPSGQGNLLIKLTCFSRKNFLEIDKFLKDSVLAPVPLGKPEWNEQKRYEGKYYFHKKIDLEEPVQASEKMIQIARLWLETLNSCGE